MKEENSNPVPPVQNPPIQAPSLNPPSATIPPNLNNPMNVK